MKDDAAAEVIGVILIVVITVVVAAIVAAFAFNMGSIKKPYMVYFKLDKPALQDNVIITNAGGIDLGVLQKIEISYTNAADVQTSFDTPENIIATSSGHASGDLSNQVTSSLNLDSTMVMPNGQCHVIVRGTFADGTQQVLMQGDI